MATTALVWFRRDLRVHDHPPLHTALAACERVVPVFVLDDRIVGGRFPSAARVEFMLEALGELRQALRDRGGDLVVRHGPPERELVTLAAETGAEAVYFASDVSPYATRRDTRVEAALREAGVEPRRTPGNFAADVGKPRTKDGRPFVVFTPFWRAWKTLPRRDVHEAPRAIPMPSGVRVGTLPSLGSLGLTRELSKPLTGGETEGRKRMDAWLRDGIGDYANRHNLVEGGTSMLSPYLHFGCVSARELEARAEERAGKGPSAFTRQVAWRDFYAHVLLHHPANARHAFQRDLDAIRWEGADEHFDAWREGRTGYPIVDAGMRQLATLGWMHNRARLITACFLVKDLHVDWRRGEAHFMRLLLDGDEAQNNGNWQWISSVGVDPAPLHRRLYNPMLQQQRHDPDGTYVRRWVPELRGVPLKRLPCPWEMDLAEQAEADCVIGTDYPEPIVDHKVERERTLAAYRAARP